MANFVTDFQFDFDLDLDNKNRKIKTTNPNQTFCLEIINFNRFLTSLICAFHASSFLHQSEFVKKKSK